jgi:hypothetical protein
MWYTGATFISYKSCHHPQLSHRQQRYWKPAAHNLSIFDPDQDVSYLTVEYAFHISCTCLHNSLHCPWMSQPLIRKCQLQVLRCFVPCSVISMQRLRLCFGYRFLYWRRSILLQSQPGVWSMLGPLRSSPYLTSHFTSLPCDVVSMLTKVGQTSGKLLHFNDCAPFQYNAFDQYIHAAISSMRCGITGLPRQLARTS